jgi:AraC-like DNA-binding protein
MRKIRLGIIRLSNEDLPERDRMEVIRETYGRTIIKHDIEPLPDCPFRFDATLYDLPGLGIASVSISPCRAPRRPEHVSGDDLVLNVSLSGGRTLSQRGRELTVGEGEAVLTSADPGVATIPSGSRIISFRIARDALEPMVADLDACLLRPIPRDTPALRLLTGYVRVVEEAGALASPELRNLLVAHFRDLVALTVGATRDAAETARGRGVRGARLRAIKAHIMETLGRADLTIDAVAARHAITPRYVGKLFESEGTTFSEFVRGCRLALAHRKLCDPRLFRQRIGAIALECGFADPSYFNRAFRKQYGATPSDVRAAARQALA